MSILSKAKNYAKKKAKKYAKKAVEPALKAINKIEKNAKKSYKKVTKIGKKVTKIGKSVSELKIKLDKVLENPIVQGALASNPYTAGALAVYNTADSMLDTAVEVKKKVTNVKDVVRGVASHPRSSIDVVRKVSGLRVNSDASKKRSLYGDSDNFRASRVVSRSADGGHGSTGQGFLSTILGWFN